MILNLFLLLIFFSGLIASVLLYFKKKQRFPLEDRKKAYQLLWKTNLKSKSDWIILILALIAYIFVLFIYKYEKVAFAIFYIPMWFVLAQTIFRNRQTLIKAGFSHEQAAADFKIGLFMILSYCAFLILMFIQM